MKIRKALILFILMVAALPVAGQDEDNSTQVVATYFHRTYRCQTCLQIEEMARYAVEMERAEAIHAGRLTWRAVNFEEEEGTRFADEFDLESPTLVLTLVTNGKVVKSRKLEETWNLYGDAKKFDAYVLGALDEYLGVASGSERDTGPE